ncbi:MAG: beta-N-acetylhexosaminidase [Chitinophagaceae bacterium]|uniref:beta-N-acetylhexosaminidase n=1 Tax=unclassified Paraflavitalea TaxID=2798305 RepID=UPI003D3566F6|nr:beta-N-acetylhexosaminidase [Chitinophagaceae bacterium]
MKYLILVTLFLLCASGVMAQGHSLIFPTPQKLSYREGKLFLKNITIYTNPKWSAEERFAVEALKTNLVTASGLPLKKALNPTQSTLSILVKAGGGLLPTPNENVKGDREGYSLEITEKGISITATTSTGLFYAAQTISQLVEAWGQEAFLPFVSIQDQPVLPYRGVMMDMAHGGLPTVDEIKKQIDFLSRWKTNQYYFYNEVSIEMNGFDDLNYKQGYSQAQMKEIIEYGKLRHMDVVPFVAFYGHLHDLLKKERYSKLAIGNFGHELDPRNPEVGRILKNWIKQYVELFPSAFVHIGFDETWETNRLRIESDSSIHSEELWLQHLRVITDEFKSYGKTVMAWTDMTSYYPELMNKFPEDVIPVIWEYSPDTAALHHYLDPILKAGKKFIIQPAVSGWGHIYPAAAYTYDNIDLCIQEGMKNKTKGFITSVWTDAVEPFVRPSWSFMAYGCATAWSGKEANRNQFESCFGKVLVPNAGEALVKANALMAESVDLLYTCLGKNTGNMPGGTIIESWSNPFNEYYLSITKEKEAVFRLVRSKTEEASDLLIGAIKKSNGWQQSYLESMRVTANLLHYEASRFLWAHVMCTRWDKAMLETKRNSFVFYDLGYICHGLVQDMMDELGTLKEDYKNAWLSENMNYRLNTMMGRFDVEMGLWQKLLLKMIDHRIKHAADEVSTKPFAQLFNPDF